MELSNTKLINNSCYVDGKWLKASDGSITKILNPANQEELGVVSNGGAIETNKAIKAAVIAQKKWAKTPSKEKSEVLNKLYLLMLENQEDLARIITYEQGKPLLESRGEVLYGASFIQWFAEEAKRVYGDIIPGHMGDRRTIVIKQPIGVVGCITPWNFPSAMLARKMGPALASGCAMVCKPAPQTPFSALALAYLSKEAGLPGGLFNVVISDAESFGNELLSSSEVKKLTFTGSTVTGKKLLKASANTVKRVSLELGGHAPFIVFDDADIDSAIEGAVAAKYRNTGQTCVCANRIYVQSNIYKKFCIRFIEKVKSIKTGNGMDSGIDQGPLIDQNALNKVNNHIKNAKELGGDIALGGNPHKLGGLFFEPTIITNANDDMLISNEETFGPVAPIFSFDTEKEVLVRANNSPYGLASYFYTKDLARSWRVSEQLEYGMVGLNTGIISTEMAPFGGIKESGIGREGSKYGMDDYLEIKYISVAGVDE
ncbi:MAG: NAD-dependent succinate-semialdehyde dehydrogenase [Gammaproteobacteria bacterium]|nr:NAD-dependent succinate-semialdehyde dehydrogenase [Gammaproteobacteria bacterium]